MRGHLRGVIAVSCALAALALLTAAGGQASIEIEPSPGEPGPFFLQRDATAAGNGALLYVNWRHVRSSAVIGVVTVSAWPKPIGTPTPTPTFAACSVQWETTDDPMFAGAWIPLGSPITIGSVGADTKVIAAVTPVVNFVRARLIGAPNAGLTVTVSATLLGH